MIIASRPWEWRLQSTVGRNSVDSRNATQAKKHICESHVRSRGECRARVLASRLPLTNDYIIFGWSDRHVVSQRRGALHPLFPCYFPVIPCYFAAVFDRSAGFTGAFRRFCISTRPRLQGFTGERWVD